MKTFISEASTPSIANTDPVVEELVDQFLEAEDCLSHVWIAEFLVLQRHDVEERLSLVLAQQRAEEGLTRISIDQEGLEWNILQTV